MKKIISLFQRNYDGDRLVRDEVTPGAEWVIAGEGLATRKWDGTCCMVRDGKLFKRYDAKRGKTPPANFEPAQDYDEITGHMPGWIPVGDEPESQWHREAFARHGYILWGTVMCTRADLIFPDGTYELCGPKVNGGNDGFEAHYLVKHGGHLLDIDGKGCPRRFDGIRRYLSEHKIEGVVWHHPDGRMVKIKARDFGLSWPRIR